MLLAILAFVGAATPAAYADGSVSLTQSGNGFRANLEWRTSAYGDGTLTRRTLLKAFVKAGEYVMVGSSAVDVPGSPDNGDVRVYAPNTITGPIGQEKLPATPTFSCLDQRQRTGNTAQGRIDTRAKELAGPATIADAATATPGAANPGGYVPCFFQATETGVYNIAFIGPAGDGKDTFMLPSGSINDTAANYDSRQTTSVAVWDVTVRSDLMTTTRQEGRLFAYYLAMFTGDNGRPVQAKVVVVTDDGYRYLVDVRGMDPNGFLLYGNRLGFLDSDGTPLYRDVLPDTNLDFQGQNQLQQLQGGVRLAPPQYPIFFEEPSNETLTALGIPLTPILPRVNSFTFTGPQGGNTTSVGTGGVFTFESSVAGVYEAVLSRDGLNFDPTDPKNRVLRGVAQTSGMVSIKWDGLDNSGKAFPTGFGYLARISVHGGEFHFPFLDVENSLLGSPQITMLNPPDADGDGVGDCPPLTGGCSAGVYDDRGYRTADGTIVGTGINQPLCAGNVGNPPKPLYSGHNGFDTKSDQRRFGFSSGGNPRQVCVADGGFGDKKGLDLWTYYPSEEVITPLNIVAALAVDLASLSATKTDEGVQVAWVTRSERNTVGFHVLRSTTGNIADAVRVTPSMIPARGSTGGAYQWLDTQPADGATYWLEEYEANGGTNTYGPARVAVAAALRTYWLPVVLQ